MSFKIFQSFYKPEHTAHLTPGLHWIDNSNSPTPELCEYPIHLKCYEIATNENVDTWGLLSWNWKDKMPKLDANQILRFIDSNPGYDVYFINPCTDVEAIAYNVWEQGCWMHPNIITICESLFPLMGLPVDLLYQPMSYSTTCYTSNYFGNKKFWDKWLAFVNKFVDAVELLPVDIKKMYNSSAGYQEKIQLNYFPFIYERLFNTFLQVYKHEFTVKSLSHAVEELPIPLLELRTLKEQALLTCNLDLIKRWYAQRTSQFSVARNHAAEWVNNITW